MAMRPTAESERLGAHLASLRHELRPKISQITLATRMNELARAERFSQSTISHIENGSGKIEQDDLELWLSVVNAAEEQAVRVRKLWDEAYGEARYDDEHGELRGRVSEPLGTFGGLCRHASTILSYDTVFWTGLLAHEAYTRKLAEGHRAFVEPVNLNYILNLRKSWQRRLSEPDFGGMSVVITEGAVRTGPPDILIPQLQHVLEVTRPIEEDEPEFRAPVTLYVLPRDVVPPGLDSFVLFNSEDEPPVVFVDGDGSQDIYRGRIKAHQDRIQQYRYTHNAAVALALTPDESRDLVSDVLEEISDDPSRPRTNGGHVRS
jgi:transcriptional regulator with XRE-family HTH domain